MKAFPETFLWGGAKLPIRWKVPGRKMAKGSRPQFTASWRNGKNGTAHPGEREYKDVAIDFYHRYPEDIALFAGWASPVCVFPLPGREFSLRARS